MNKRIDFKEIYLFVMLFVVGVFSGICQADISSVSARAESAAGQFSAVVNGVNVDFDWSAMGDADSYTMALALVDAVGNIDMSTIQFLDMGTERSFSTTGLTSGMIFYAAILADTAQGLVVSNSLKFMPFAGVVTYPEVGDVLMQVDDPGGIGNFTVSGSVSGETANITQITGNDGSGPFVLTVVNDKPVTYVKGDLTMNFTCLADGSVVVQSVRNRAEASAQEVLDCREEIKARMNSATHIFKEEYDSYAAILMVLTDLTMGTVGFGTPNDPQTQKLSFLLSLLAVSRSSLAEQFAKKMADLKQEYEDCSNDPGGVIIDPSCPIPAGAEYKEIHYQTSTVQHYVLNGENVGPWRWWGLDAGSEAYLKSESCKNALGQLNGWAIEYYKNGNMERATHYKDGMKDGHDYIFYCNETVFSDGTYVNDVRTYVKHYDEAGNLCSYCDCAGDGVTHIVCKSPMRPPGCE